MLPIKPILPNFLKTLVVASMAFGSVATFADDHKKAEKIGDLKDMEAKHSLKADELTNKLDGDTVVNSLTEQSEGALDKAEEMTDKVEEIKPGE